MLETFRLWGPNRNPVKTEDCSCFDFQHSQTKFCNYVNFHLNSFIVLPVSTEYAVNNRRLLNIFVRHIYTIRDSTSKTVLNIARKLRDGDGDESMNEIEDIHAP